MFDRTSAKSAFTIEENRCNFETCIAINIYGNRLYFGWEVREIVILWDRSSLRKKTNVVTVPPGCQVAIARNAFGKELFKLCLHQAIPQIPLPQSIEAIF
jgi:hypothetical protein